MSPALKLNSLELLAAMKKWTNLFFSVGHQNNRLINVYKKDKVNGLKMSLRKCSSLISLIMQTISLSLHGLAQTDLTHALQDQTNTIYQNV
ncbi:hypothetical protein BpHYR1_027046 [Brachionus plicatilis]|uniref:Uncharacterized protein n=1 Tax=Brachionus plicatilis TaxID=10195 RepID=A0A3M7PUL7_BRAPC|nr:hypothetical protein BpHYR1_027046 [Brachionus plicatilis]